LAGRGLDQVEHPTALHERVMFGMDDFELDAQAKGGGLGSDDLLRLIIVVLNHQQREAEFFHDAPPSSRRGLASIDQSDRLN